MSDDIEREDAILGTALARAVESQPVRETPYERSRVMARMSTRPRSVLAPLFAAAGAVALGLTLGTALLAGRGGDRPPVATEPSPTASPAVTASPAPTVTPGATLRQRVYLVRDQLPPVGVDVDTAAEGPQTPESRIRSRFDALATASAPSGLGNSLASSRTKPTVRDVVIAGDLARVDWNVPNGDWGVGGTAGQIALLQQLVYTATEEPGVRRVMLTENGGKPTTVTRGHGTEIDRPLAREDVFGYAERGQMTPMQGFGERTGAIRNATTKWSVDEVAPGLARFEINFDQAIVSPVSGHPDFSVTMRLPTPADPPSAKWILEIQVFQAVNGRAGTTAVDRSPLRSVTTTAGKGPGAPMIYLLALDDARPWRTALAFEPVRIIVDIGGVPGTIDGPNAVYAPRPSDTVGRSFVVAGVEHNFEAHVDIRVRDAAGRVVLQTAATGTNCCDPGGTFEKRIELPQGVNGNVTLEVYEGSQKDGSDTKVIRIPLTVR